MNTQFSTNTIFQAALQLSGKKLTDDNITSYHILYGYSKLVVLDEEVLHEMFSDEEYRDLSDARRFFRDNDLDSDLLRKGMPFLFPFLGDAGFLSDDELSGKDNNGNLSSYSILKTAAERNNEILSYFRKGKSLEDVFLLQEKMKEETARQKAEAKKSEDSFGQDEIVKKRDRGQSTGGEVSGEDTARKEDGLRQTRENVRKKKGKDRFIALSEIYRELRVRLLEVVQGQSGPVAEFVQGCYQGEVLENKNQDRKKPKNVFLFVGPPGVGKTLLAQTAADVLMYPSKTFNMSEYSAHQSHEGLIGVSPIYGNAQEGTLVGFVRENPECILIFDEIEKAHRNTIQIFLQILDQGTADNAFLKNKTDFSKATIIFTSNACRSIYESTYENLSATPKSVILGALRNEKDSLTGEKVFPDAICSRIASGNIIMFNYLSSRELMRLTESNFELTAQQINEEFGYHVDIDPRLAALFMFHHGGTMDARIASQQSDKFIKNELFELTRQLESHKELLDEIRTLKFELGLDTGDTPDTIRELFASTDHLEMAVMCRPEDRGLFDLPEGYVVHFADSEEDMKNLLDQNLMLILIDLRVGLVDTVDSGISLDDYDSTGIRTFEMLCLEDSDVPIRLFISHEKMTETDINTFLRRGADGIVNAVGVDPESVHRQIQQIAEEVFLDRQARDFARQGKILSFNTAQIAQDHTMIIRYHALKRVQAIDAESSSSLLLDADRPDICFDDVIGAENAKKELRAFIKYLSNPRKEIREGAKPAKGLLLYGPAGTGKTMLARAMAGETDFAFLQTSATEFLNKWFGQSEQNVRDIFKRAKKYAPSIIFIDEIDAIGKTRTGENRNTESVLNALLTEMDGFSVDIKKPVFVIAATNYQIEGGTDSSMTLDPALVRRFDNRVYVDLPNEKERIEYLTREIRGKGFHDIEESVIRNVAERTPGFSIAILQNILGLAQRIASDHQRLPNGFDLLTALEEYNFGEKKEWNEEYYRAVSIHESGHAYIAWLSGEKPSYITIESRGNFGGYMQHANAEDKPNYTKNEIIWRIRTALAGRAAEEIFFGKDASLNTGASSDLQNATKLAASMFCDYAMMEGQFVALPFDKILNSSMVSSCLDQINALLSTEMHNTVALVEEGREKVKKLAERLLAENNLTEDRIIEILEDKK